MTIKINTRNNNRKTRQQKGNEIKEAKVKKKGCKNYAKEGKGRKK